MPYQPKCPTCGGYMWNDYESDSWGKDYYWKCSKKKKYNPNCPDKNKYFECDKCGKIENECMCIRKGIEMNEEAEAIPPVVHEYEYKCRCGRKVISRDWHHGYECCMQCFAEGHQ